MIVTHLICAASAFISVLGAASAQTAQPAPGQGFVAAWTASAHGPYPVGNATAQPELKFALPSPDRGGADQSFRLIVRPDVWGPEARIRLSNAFGTKPVTFDAVTMALRSSGAELVAHTSVAVTFGGNGSVTVPPGKTAVSDAVALTWVRDPADPLLANRNLAVSIHVVGETGPITWHAKGLTTSYISPPGSGDQTQDETGLAYPFSTTSWFFLDEVAMKAPQTRAVVAFGDSITDGTASTLNGDDRWPDVLSRRVHAAFGQRFSVINEGIGGNMIIGPDDYAAHPFAGGPAATERLERDLISLPGVSTVIWLEGINDFGNAAAEPDKVIDGVRDAVKRLRAAIPGVKIHMATLTSSLNSTNGGYGAIGVDRKRRAFNDFIRKTDIFDGVVDFDAVTLDPKTGELRAEFQPNSTTGGPGDKLHPNRAGYAAMGSAIDLDKVLGAK
jgi:lysophospholipase L1-like esterase